MELLDLYPTVAELAGLKHSDYLQGKSLVKTLDDTDHKVCDAAFSVTKGGDVYLLRIEKWVYIV